VSISNRERVGRAFELLAAGLEPYVAGELRAAVGQKWWEIARARVDGGRGLKLSPADPQVQLRVLAEFWQPVFGRVLGRTERTLVFELQDVRNRWAHNDRFSADDAYRALDSIERLLIAVSALEATDVTHAKQEVLRLRYEQEARKATPTETPATASVVGLHPWREVIRPHHDVATGRFQQAEFAADLAQVHRGEGAPEYRDPVEFFRRTYLTQGLRDLLLQATQRVTGSGGVPVVNLQTNFGGGKTHSLLALYHLLSGIEPAALPQEVQDLLRPAGINTLPPVQRAVLVGTALRPGQPSTKPDGTVVRTLWGELAWQLGGADGYALVAKADETGTNPGDALVELFRRHTPCLVLIDEWVAYARQLYSRDDLPAGTFDVHFTFAQALTEASRAVPGVLTVISIPASEPRRDALAEGDGTTDVEVGGVGGREALRRLRNAVGRMESSWRPASAEESFEIVRRRLFEPIDPHNLRHRDATARVFADYYRAQNAEFPADCRESAYAERIKAAYPIHPELFARLYGDWSTLDRFQRTRGVLRLMAAVVHALWQRNDQAPLILPASLPLDDTAVLAEVTRHLEDNWKPIT
jgi:predicted AAA+ superfamily ATPase